MLAPLVGAAQFIVPEVVGDVPVVIILLVFRESVPGLEAQGEVAVLDDEVRIDPIPATRQHATAAVGLVHQADRVRSVGEAQEIPVGVELRPDLRFVVGLPEWRGFVVL